MSLDALIFSPPASPALSGRSRRRPKRAHRAYSLIEMLLTIILVQLIGGLVAVQVSSAASTEKCSYAAQETVAAMRYARQLALTTGTPCGVIFDDVNQKITVFRGNTSTIATNSVIAGGRYIIDLKKQSNVSGVKIASITLLGGTNIKTVTYGNIGAISGMPRGLGSTANNGTIEFSCGTARRRIVIPDAGEPTIQ